MEITGRGRVRGVALRSIEPASDGYLRISRSIRQGQHMRERVPTAPGPGTNKGRVAQFSSSALFISWIIVEESTGAEFSKVGV